MSNRFFISAAVVALIAGTSFANAQGTGTSKEAPAAAQQSAPSSEPGGAASGTMKHEEKTTPSSGMKSSQTEQKQPAAGANQRAEDSKVPGQKSKSSENEGARDATKGGKDMKAEERSGSMSKEKAAEDRSGSMSKEKAASDTKSMDSKSQTTGQAGAGAKLSTEQRTKITTVIKEQHVAPVTNVNFSIAVGTRVPRTVEFHPLPAEVVTIYPEWRGYNFILVKNEIVVIDPRTFEIVAVIEA